MRLSKMIGAVLVSTLLCAAPVGAQPAPPIDDQLRATARSLADEGMTLYEQRKYAEALDRFERAGTIIQAPTITLHAARSLDKLGKLVEAAERYRTCINTPLDATAPDAFRGAQDAARSELQALMPRIPSVEISVVGPGADQAVVTLDGKPVLRALIGVKLLLNPGEHKIAASTATHANAQDVNIQEKQVSPVVLTLVSKVEGGSDGQTITPDKPGKPSTFNGKKIAGITALGVGGAFTILGVVGLVSMASALDELDTYCAGGICDKDPLDGGYVRRTEAYDSSRYLAIAGFAVGGVGLAAGTALLLLSKPKADVQPKTSSALTIKPWIGIGSAGFNGTF